MPSKFMLQVILKKLHWIRIFSYEFIHKFIRGFYNVKFTGFGLNHFYLNNFDSKSVIIDLGSNKFNLYYKFIEKNIPFSRMICFDIQDFTDIIPNDLRISFENAAISTVSSNVVAYICSDRLNEYSSLHKTKYSSSDERIIKSYSIENILENYSITECSYLKIDIEGEEYNLFNDKNINWNIFLQISLEYHKHIPTEFINKMVTVYNFKYFISTVYREILFYK